MLKTGEICENKQNVVLEYIIIEVIGLGNVNFEEKIVEIQSYTSTIWKKLLWTSNNNGSIENFWKNALKRLIDKMSWFSYST